MTRNLTNLGEFDFSNNDQTQIIVGSTFKPEYHGFDQNNRPIDTQNKFILHYICNTAVNGDDYGFSGNYMELTSDEFMRIFGSVDNFKAMCYKPVYFITVPHPDPKKKAKGINILQTVIVNSSFPAVKK